MSTLQLRIIVENPPPTSDEVAFGLQDKAGNLREGEPQRDGSLVFVCEVNTIEGDTLNFRGDVVHGTPKARFLYLSYGRREGNGWIWIRRIKLMLASITPDMIDAAQGGALEAKVDGRAAATVRSLWHVRETPT